MFLQVSEKSFDEANLHMNQPQFAEVAKALENGKLFSFIDSNASIVSSVSF